MDVSFVMVTHKTYLNKSSHSPVTMLFYKYPLMIQVYEESSYTHIDLITCMLKTQTNENHLVIPST